MKICGLQKTTLLDYPEHIACTVFLGGCNLRCPFCHNADLVVGKVEGIYSKEDILKYLHKRVGVLDGVCVTGGEPLIYEDTLEFLGELKSMGFLVKLDTNGFFPDRLEKALKSGNVDYVAMDIKSSIDGYAAATGVASPDIDAVKRSIKLLESSGVDHEYRTTVVRELHGEKEIAAIEALIGGAKKYFLQGFIDSGKVLGGTFTAHPKEKMHELLAVARKYVHDAQLRGIE
ncbi:MAG: anaerobic ribonucleoside-triphosphate reductase activating protein [Clostridia bacterium]|nr:anaerobic ribonucleoside-triphosphate reductase activating protein [Clostridia bacterium]